MITWFGMVETVICLGLAVWGNRNFSMAVAVVALFLTMSLRAYHVENFILWATLLWSIAGWIVLRFEDALIGFLFLISGLSYLGLLISEDARYAFVHVLSDACLLLACLYAVWPSSRSGGWRFYVSRGFHFTGFLGQEAGDKAMPGVLVDPFGPRDKGSKE